MDYAASARRIVELLGLRLPPVAIAFADAAPAGVPRIAASEPASCSYWSRAARGEVFYTAADDHLGCPIGAHTHGAPLSDAKRAELGGMVDMMVGLGYLDADEVPSIPTRSAPLAVAVYAPLELAPLPPEVVITRGDARQVMLLAEAARAALGGEGLALGRPTCALLPQAAGGRALTSLGCIGNRVYTGLGDEELYYAFPGAHLEAVVERLATVVAANRTLAGFHGARRVGSASA
jgi:uncharacterized protein (DUF169 family)